MKRALLLVFVVSLLFAGACGKDKDSEGADKACGPAPSAQGTVDLPAGFPTPSGTTYTASAKTGPTNVIDGFSTSKLADAFTAYKGALGQAPYAVTKSEKDAHDAEVNFESADSTGQVKLQDACRDRVSVKVTVRPK